MEGLTGEQKERIARNRQRALEIRRKREEEANRVADTNSSATQINNTTTTTAAAATTTTTTSNNNHIKQSYGQQKKQNETIKNDVINIKNNPSKQQDEDDEKEEEELEDFEINAAPHVTKTEATKVYCLPEGTLSVCNYIEKTNPKHGKWSNMKLYNRKDIRKRARERFGGLEGLVEERNRRERKRFERDWEDVEAMNVFKRHK